MFKKIFFTITSILFIAPFKTFAHEAYVLDHADFWSKIKEPFSVRAFDALLNPENIKLTLIIGSGIFLFMLINFLFRLTQAGEGLHNKIERFSFLGPIFVRITIAVSFFFSAYSWSFLGPELSLQDMVFPQVLQIVLYAISFMIAFGLFTRVAALGALIIYTMSFYFFGSYMITYLNYLGEIIVLLIFGMRVWSLDFLFFGPLKYFKKYEKYETTIVRIFYGVALAFAGVTVKFLHPELTLEVVNHWNLTQFRWLFPSDPLLVVFGAGLSELLIGLLIIVGFEVRATVCISLFYITLSLLFFRELVWPHLLLYGISLNLLVQPEIFTLDHFIFEKHRRDMKWWKRLFQPHSHVGKSHR